MANSPVKKVVVEIDKIRNPYSGLGQFCLHLGRALVEAQPLEIDLEFALAKGHHTAEDFGSFRQVSRFQVLNSKSTAPQIWHSTHQDSPYSPPRSSKFILTIHDLNFLEKYSSRMRQAWRLKLLQRKIDRCDALTTISHYSAQIIRDHLNIRDKPLHVIYNGCNHMAPVASTPMQPVKSPFLFNIGVIQPRKNLEVLLPLMERINTHKLVIAGSAQPRYLEALKKRIDELRIHNKVIFTGPITDAEKQWYYNHCDGFVFPSRSEGFGLPIIEAMQVGKPVFLSTFTCLPEIGGDLANYWDHFEPDHMLNVLEKGLKQHNPEKSALLVKWSEKFSWPNAANAYWNLYQSLL